MATHLPVLPLEARRHLLVERIEAILLAHHAGWKVLDHAIPVADRSQKRTHVNTSIRDHVLGDRFCTVIYTGRGDEPGYPGREHSRYVFTVHVQQAVDEKDEGDADGVSTAFMRVLDGYDPIGLLAAFSELGHLSGIAQADEQEVEGRTDVSRPLDAVVTPFPIKQDGQRYHFCTFQLELS